MRLAVSVLLLLLQASGMSSVLAQTPASDEYAVKAAFLFHFAQFVEWPEGTFQGANSPLVYCTIGEDPFRGVMDASLKDKAVRGHPLQVRHLKQIQDAQVCQVVFVGVQERGQIEPMLSISQQNSILTVGESEAFVRAGGMISFCLEERRIRFDINLQTAERANLKISAKLLALAKTVIGKPRRD
ncbi:MAG TPA: YfiR family protein [Candidatus Acidoferrum sp.]|nr:YfiR family protein [Candidatus Acidoferrum sp.]